MKNILLILSAVLLFQTAAFAQGAIDGRVLNSKTAQGLPNVNVNVVGPDGKVVANVTTDDSGAFTVEDLAAGTYKIFVRDAKGFQPAEQANITVEDDETATVLLKLSAVVAVTPQGGGQPQPKPTATSGCTTGSASIPQQFTVVNARWVNSFDGNTILSTRQSDRQNGTVKWFNDCKGFGFITPESGVDLFVHIRSLMTNSFMMSLKEGQKVTFKVVQGAKGLQANDVLISL